MEKQFKEMAERVTKLDLNIDATSPISLIRTKQELGNIVQDLSKLLEFEVSSSESGDGSLKTEIEELLNQTASLYQALDASIMQAVRLEAERNNNTNNLYDDDDDDDDDEDEDDDDDDSDEEEDDDDNTYDQQPLTRDEIAKLLLVTTRAASFGHLTDTQKGLIKDDIVRRRPYLRHIIHHNENIPAVMHALRALAESMER